MNFFITSAITPITQTVSNNPIEPIKKAVKRPVTVTPSVFEEVELESESSVVVSAQLIARSKKQNKLPARNLEKTI